MSHIRHSVRHSHFGFGSQETMLTRNHSAFDASIVSNLTTRVSERRF